MMYKCLECGTVFGEDEVSTWKERRGEWMGSPCIVEEGGCPRCRGDYKEAFKCDICEGFFFKDELHENVCDGCINDYRNDFEMCYKISKSHEEDVCQVEINGLLATLFDATHIENILVEHIRRNCPDIDCSEYIDVDKWWFGANLKEEVNKHETEKGEP